MRHLGLAILTAAIGLGAIAPGALPAAAGVIRGVLKTTPHRARLRTGAGAVPVAQKNARDAVIYLQLVPGSVEKKLSKTARPAHIVQRRLAFVPHVLAEPVGTVVEIENLDGVYHNTFSVSAARRFDLGKVPPGAIGSVVFNRVGVANLHCDIHPDESAYVVVVPNHAYTRPDSLGRFELPDLPMGHYQLRVWHPRLGDITRGVDMPRHGDITLELRF